MFDFIRTIVFETMPKTEKHIGLFKKKTTNGKRDTKETIYFQLCTRVCFNRLTFIYAWLFFVIFIISLARKLHIVCVFEEFLILFLLIYFLRCNITKHTSSLSLVD